ncbi:MAG: hydroxymethylbilane synthase [Selenomonadaceae bacterium]|nr:hydroxymethylbilane synthase [Selenomonadaceae bacterium]
MRKIRIGTRASRLALWQAEFVAAELKKFFPELEIEIVKVRTTGDKILDAPLAKIGGKGLFTKELESQMIQGAIDLAVHSLKDVPTELPAGFKIAAITRRAQPFDAFVSNKFSSFDALPKNSVVGTSSLRRAAQILSLRPDLQIKNLRGNVETRLKKLDAGEFDAIILAAAGLDRLGYSSRINELLTEIIPAAGQGALAIETRADDEKIFSLVQVLNDEETCAAVKVEREFLTEVGGSCQIPVGVFATIDGGQIKVRALIASIDGQKIVKTSEIATLEKIDGLGKKIAAKLLDSGGREILNELILKGAD